MSDEILKKIEAKLDTVIESQNSMNVTLAKQEVSLTDHMRRTELLEERTDVLFEEIRPLQSHVASTNSVVKFILGFGTVAGAIVGIIKLLGKM